MKTKIEFGRTIALVMGLSFYNAFRSVSERLPDNMLTWSVGEWIFVTILSACSFVLFALALRRD
jgi:hypothetical protein